jgi:protoporphyrinogen/coproporphyrinogen III oxidase
MALSDASLIDALHAELVSVLDIRSAPTEAVVSRWINGFPQYDVGHAARVARIESWCSTLPGLSLAGASYRGIGLPACIRDAKAAVASLR